MKHSHSTTLSSPPATTELLQVNNPVNQRWLQDFTRQIFARQYQANIQDFLPNMLALLDKQQQIRASIGFQSAEGNQLYLEHYLPNTIEQCISEQAEVAVPPRSSILEVGNLASQSSGSTRRLILGLANHFHQQQFSWLVITATPQVINSFEKLHLQSSIYKLANANSAAVQTSSTCWGSYYQQTPAVYAIDIENGLKDLNTNIVIARMLERAGPVSRDTDICFSKGVA